MNTQPENKINEFFETALLLFNEFFGENPQIAFNVDTPNEREEIILFERMKLVRHLTHRIVVFFESTKRMLIKVLFYFSQGVPTPYCVEVTSSICESNCTEYIGLDAQSDIEIPLGRFIHEVFKPAYG